MLQSNLLIRNIQREFETGVMYIDAGIFDEGSDEERAAIERLTSLETIVYGHGPDFNIQTRQDTCPV